MSDTRPHDHQHRDRFLARLRARLSYANVMATLGVFLALTGTATAAIVLPPDSVGAEQIQADAVRSPEIEADAVRSPEIEADAVRSPEIEADAVRSSEIAADAVRGSEILDESVVLADLSPGARASLDAPRVRDDEGWYGLESVPECDSMLACPNLMMVHLPAGRWVVLAKLSLLTVFPSDIGTSCALVESDSEIVDFATDIGRGSEARLTGEQVTLMDVVTTAPGVDSTTVAVRCEDTTEDDYMYWRHAKLTAFEVKDEAQED